MRIHVECPSVMKVKLSLWVDLEEPATLDDAKRKIYDVFWSKMLNYASASKHGNPDQVTIQDLTGVTILSDSDLQERIASSDQFIALFKVHAHAELLMSVS